MPRAFTVNITADDRELQAALNRALVATGDLTPAMQAIGERILRSTDERFTTETTPTLEKWSVSKAAADEGRKTLTKSHQLRNSIWYRAGKDAVRVGSPKPYGAIHQFGGKAGIKGRVVLPARPFLGVTEDDKREISAIISDHLTSAVNG
ncbi:MAG: phage virion morphogenesis protein [Desulfuromonas sp.]|nr:MAG: phage virion morphogenesis protein [Desulfuromonas sp.]